MSAILLDPVEQSIENLSIPLPEKELRDEVRPREIKVGALEERAQFLSHFIGDQNVENNKDTLKDIIGNLAYNDETGEKLPIKEFEKRIFELFSPVFTGHPVWNQPPEQSKAFQARARSLGQRTGEDGTKEALVATVDQKFETPTLKQENDDTLEVVKTANAAMSMAERIAIEVGQEEYPDEWHTINYTVGLVYKWTTHDWDGREDIPWNLPFADKLQLQFDKLENDTLPALKATRAKTQNYDVYDKMDAAIEKMEFTIDYMKEKYEFFLNYHTIEDPGYKKLQEVDLDMNVTLDKRFTHPKELTDLLDEAFNSLSEDQQSARTDIVALRTALNGRGLTWARTHSRINAKKIKSALTKSKIGNGDTSDDPGIIPADIDAEEVNCDDLYLPALQERHDRAEKNGPKPSDLVSLARAQSSVGKQILMTKMGFDLVDGHAMPTQLVADVKDAFAPAGFVTMAKEYGAEDTFYISPLLEEKNGLENNNAIINHMLGTDLYMDHLVNPREHDTFPYVRIYLETGLSDLTRQFGLSAAAFQERTLERFVNAVAKRAPEGVGLVKYPTGGEHPFRGRHWGSYLKTLERAVSGHLLETERKRERLGLATTQLAFQGQDGFNPFNSPEAAFAILTQSMQHLTADHRKTLEDIFYRDFRKTLGYMTHIRDESLKFNERPEFLDLLEIGQNLNPVAGSRSPSRNKPKAGEKKKRPRAIGQSNIMQSWGLPACIVMGMTHVFNNASHEFIQSERFKQDIEIFDIAADLYDPRVGHAYIEHYNPEYWQKKASNNPEKASIYRDIAETLEGSKLFTDLKPLVREVSNQCDDAKTARQRFDNLVPKFADSAYQPSEDRKISINEIHRRRLFLMESVWEKLFSIKDFGQTDISRDEIMQKIIRFDLEGIKMLQEIFPVPDNEVEPIHDKFERHTQNGGVAVYKGIQNIIKSALDDIQRIKELSVTLEQLHFGRG